MTNYTLDGQKLRIAIIMGTKTREKIVADVQDMIREKGLSFSFAGLCKMIDGELPKRDGEVILDAVAKVLGKSASDFAGSEAKTA